MMAPLLPSKLFVSLLQAVCGLCIYCGRLIAVASFFATIGFVCDANAANVTSVTSTSPNGTYSVGQTINVRVTMSEAVTVTGIPQLTLETGSSDAVVSYSGAQDTPVTDLDFTYTVATGNISSDLDYPSTSSLALNGGSILDSATNPASLTLPTPGAANSLGANSAIAVDGVAPTVSNVTSSTANGSYRAGQTISIQVNFSEAVTVSGTPTLTLETGASDAIVSYTGGSGTSSLTFSFIIAAGANSSDLDCQSANALALNGGTIVDAAGNNATTTVATGAATANSLANNKALVVDTTAPQVSNVTSSTANGSYRASQSVSIQIVFSEAVIVTDTPQLALETGTSDAVVNYTSGSGTTTLTFTYTITAGHVASDLDYISTAALSLNSGTIRDAASNDATLTLSSPGSAGSLGANKNIVVDTTTPTTSLSTSSTSPTSIYPIPVSISFSESVSGLALSDFTVTNGFVYNLAGSGSSYTVSVMPTTNGTVGVTLPASSASDAAGNPSLASSTLSVDFQTLAPTITSVTTSTSNGSYRAGQIVSLQVNFSSAVDVTGTPQLTLETGASDAVVNYTSGSGTTSLTFTYTIQAGHNSSDLDYRAYTSISALSLNGGTIRDSATGTYDAALLLPKPGAAGSLGANAAIVVDTTAPSVTSVNSSTTNGSYRAGQSISIQVNFSETVTVTGTPTLTLETGSSDAVLNYSSGNGTSSLTFTYTIVAGHNSSDLDCVGANALSLNGGTIQDSVGNDVNLAVAVGSGTANSLSNNKAIVVDTVAPTVSNVTASNANGSYKAGVTIGVQVVFSETVIVAGSSGAAVSISLDTGSATTVNYTSGSNSSTLLFNYAIANGHSSSDLAYSSTTALTRGGRIIQDAAGNDAVLTLASPGAAGSLNFNKNIVVDTSLPTVLSVSTTTADGTYKVGSPNIPITVTFSEAVTVTGTPRIQLAVGGTTYATYTAGSGTSALVFTYTIAPTNNTTDLDYSNTSALALNSGTIRDAASNNATLTLPTPGGAGSISNASAIVIDTTSPSVTSVTSTSADGYYRVGGVIDLVVNFNEAVLVTGTPQLTLETEAIDGIASYTGGSGTTALTFRYTVGAGESSSDLEVANSIALSTNDGTMRDAVGNNANLTLTLPTLSATRAIVVDTTDPSVTSVTSSTANGSYRAGQSIAIQVNFSEAVTVTGTPTMTLETGSSDAVVNYSSGSGTSSLTFTYTIVAGHNSSDLDCLEASALSVNGGAIQDAAGNDATLTVPVGSDTTNSLANNQAIIVDTVAPTVSHVTASNANGSYNAGVTIGVQVVFSETVLVAGGSGADISISLDTGSANIVHYTSGSNSTTLLFDYTIFAGESSNDLAYSSSTALTNGDATIQDAAGNDAVLTLASPGAAGSLDFNKDIVVDTAAPTVLSVSTTTADGAYKVGSPNIPITVTFSEAVTVTGTAQIQLAVGGTTYATYTSGSGTSALVFTYTIAAGDNTIDLDYSSAFALEVNSGTIQDSSLNDAALTLATPGEVGSISHESDIVVDTTSPSVTSVTTTSADGYYAVGGAIDLVVNFSEAIVVSGVPQLTVETGVTDGVASYISGSGTTALTFRYTVGAGENSSDLEVVSSSALLANGGTVRDIAGNDASLTLSLPTLSASSALVVDTIDPAVTISTSAPAITNLSPITYTASFSEDVTTFSIQDITVTNGTAGNFTQVSASNYTFEITPTADGVVEVSVAQGVAQDLAHNLNSASNVVTLTYDSVQPIVTLSSSASPSTNTSPIPVSIVFSEPVQNLSIEDISVVNGVAGNLSGSGATYSVDITPASEGSVSISLPSGAALDAAGNNSAASNVLTIIYDLIRPSVTVSSSAPSPTKDAPIPFTITFSEVPVGFASSDITVTGGSVVSFTGTGATRAITVQPAGQGDVGISIGADVAFDAAGNGNLPSNTVTRTYDSVASGAPTITAPVEGAILNDGQPTLSGTAEANSVVTVSEGGEIVCSGTAAEDGIWSCQPTTPLPDGRRAFSAVSTDAAGNSSPASTTRNIVIDAIPLTAPIVDPAVSGITSDLTPSVYGIGPAGKRVSIRKQETTLCSTEVDADGGWRCELPPLATGQHDLIAWATDTSDDTVSDDVSFTAHIGVAYRGVVTMTNRAATPLEGVVVSYQTASTTTATSGAFDLPVPDQAGVAPTLSKRGWSISLESGTPGDDGLFRYAASPTLETKSYSIWDSPTVGFLHSLKLLNKGELGATFSWSLLNSDGSILNSSSDISLGALRDYRGNLSGAAVAGPRAYGFVEIQSSNGSYDGEFESLIPGSTDTQVRTMVASPLSNALQGNSFVMFDTAAAVLDAAKDLQFVENALLLSNVDDTPQAFTVRYFSRGGSPLRWTRLELGARATGRLILGGPAQKRPPGGLIEIVPDDPSALYVGSLRRYGFKYNGRKGSGTFTRSKSFFVMSENARKASAGDTAIRHEYATTRSGAHHLELANTGVNPITVTITHHGREIRTVRSTTRRASNSRRPAARVRIVKNRTLRAITLPSHGSARLTFSKFIKTSTDGIFTISASRPNSVIANTVAHSYTSKGILTASKLSPVDEVFGDDQHGFYESNVASSVWFSNVTDAEAIASLECVVSGSAVNIIPLTIPPRESAVIKLAACFGGAASGLTRVNSSVRAGVVADRVRSRAPTALSARTRVR
jgi:hypothetical protein